MPALLPGNCCLELDTALWDRAGDAFHTQPTAWHQPPHGANPHMESDTLRPP